MSQRDKAYQPRATPWGFNAPDSRVLKERRISLDGEHVYDQPRFGVPSERERFTISVPGVAPGVVPGGPGGEAPAEPGRESDVKYFHRGSAGASPSREEARAFGAGLVAEFGTGIPTSPDPAETHSSGTGERPAGLLKRL